MVEEGVGIVENNYEDLEEYKKAIANMQKFVLENKALFDNISELSNVMHNLQPEVLQQAARLNSLVKEQLPIFRISEEMQAFVKEAKDSENLSVEEFEEKYGHEVEICKCLGRNGWVISEHTNPKIIGEWYDSLRNGNEEIINFFDKDDSRVVKGICHRLEQIYTENPYKLYYSKGIYAFEKNDYMTTAMYLTALIEARINKQLQFNVRTYREKYSDIGFEKRKNKDFKRVVSFFTKRFYFLDLYPSVIEYLNRMFVDGEYTFNSGNEPPYINRNWLLHGKTSRNIERYECIQILNALSVCEFVFGSSEN